MIAQRCSSFVQKWIFFGPFFCKHPHFDCMKGSKAVMGWPFSWLKGLKGETPPKYFQFFFTKSCQITISLKSEKNNHDLYAKYCIIIIPPPPWVNLDFRNIYISFLVYFGYWKNKVIHFWSCLNFEKTNQLFFGLVWSLKN